MRCLSQIPPRGHGSDAVTNTTQYVHYAFAWRAAASSVCTPPTLLGRASWMAGAPPRGDNRAEPPKAPQHTSNGNQEAARREQALAAPLRPASRPRAPHLRLSHRAATPASADVFVHPGQEHPFFPPFV